MANGTSTRKVPLVKQLLFLQQLLLRLSAIETALKLIIFNIVWLPTHLIWLYAGVKLNSLNLSARTQRVINLVMAACLLAVVGLSVWSVLMLAPGGALGGTT